MLTIGHLSHTVISRARRRVAGDMPDGSERIVSLHDKDARPIKKGRLGKPVEFGRKAQVTDNSDGIVVDYEVFQGNPPDGPQLPRSIARIANNRMLIPDLGLTLINDAPERHVWVVALRMARRGPSCQAKTAPNY